MINNSKKSVLFNHILPTQMAKKKKPADPLVDLLEEAKPETLINLIVELAEDRPDVRRECFDYLKNMSHSHVLRRHGRKARLSWQ